MASMALHHGEPRYEQALSELFNGNAAACNPQLVLQPRDVAEVVEAVQQARRHRIPLMVRSGGHSRFCAADGALMLDLAAHFTDITLHRDQVTVGAGAGMGAILQHLSAAGRMLPVGTHATPGFGLLCMGGLGHLSRSLGLTIDNIVALKGVRGDGSVFEVFEGCSDPIAWHWLRGAAPFLAVITEATLRTHPRQPLLVRRSLAAVETLAEHLQQAEGLSRQWSSSFVLGVPPDGSEPALMRYLVGAELDETQCPVARASGCSWTDQVPGLDAVPAFDLPAADGGVPAADLPCRDRHQRPRTWIHAISVAAGQSEALAAVLTGAIGRLPNRYCRIDLQHIGGTVSDQPINSSAYRGRGAEWSVVVTGLWPAGDEAAELDAKAWSDGVFDALEPISCHVYLAERHPGTPRYGRQLQKAYGADLMALRTLKQQWDPNGILPALE